MDPIEKIIDKLKKEHGENGAWYILKKWYEQEFKIPEKEDIVYENIYGFLYGLYATGFITRDQEKTATEYLIDIRYPEQNEK